MDKTITLQLVLTAMLLVLYPTAEGQWHPRPPVTPPPLCASQFALVNSACARLPYKPVPPPSPPTPPSPTTPTPTPPSPDGPDSRYGHSHSHRRGHHHSHSHGHRHKHKETSTEEDCCRWLKQVDNVCVCDLLVRLPPFLTRPIHNYTVVVDETCDVTFQCGSRLVR